MENSNKYEKIIEDLKNTPISFEAIRSYIEYFSLRIQNIAQKKIESDKKIKNLNETISDIKNQISNIRSEILSNDIKDFIECQVYELFNQHLGNINKRR